MHLVQEILWSLQMVAHLMPKIGNQKVIMNLAVEYDMLTHTMIKFQLLYTLDSKQFRS